MSETRDYWTTLKERGLKTALRELKSRLTFEKPTQALPKLLDLLDKYNARFTFFVVGYIADHHPEIVDILIERGHEVAAHGYYHRRMDLMAEEEIENDISATQYCFKAHFNIDLRGFRAPYLKMAESFAPLLQKYKFKWSSSTMGQQPLTYDGGLTEYPIAHDDWQYLINLGWKSSQMFAEIVSKMQSLQVLLLHPLRITRKSIFTDFESFLQGNSEKFKFSTISRMKGNSIALTGDIGEYSLWDTAQRMSHKHK